MISVPTGNPPPGFAPRLALLQASTKFHLEEALSEAPLAGSALPVVPVTPAVSALLEDKKVSPEVEPVGVTAPTLPGVHVESNDGATLVELILPKVQDFPGCVLRLRVNEVDMQFNYISLLIPEHTEILLGGIAALHLIIHGRTYPVSWVGGFFRFQRLGLNCISFLRLDTAEAAVPADRD